MNRKFVKENKALVREFLGGLITKIVTGRAPAKFQKALDKNPKIQQHKKNIQKIEKDMLAAIKDAKKNNPKFRELIKKYNLE
jgi:hypothetical protein|tara:strand:+ start:41 stop:286 length:246 start_codon:yes stop_codon:yes gene_type:complete